MALHGDQIFVRLHEGDRIDGAAVDPDFVMKVATGRAAGGAHAADHLATRNALAGADEDRRKVAIAGFNAAAMIDLDEIAVAAVIVTGVADGAVSGGVNRSSDRRGKVDTGMASGAATERI